MLSVEKIVEVLILARKRLVSSYLNSRSYECDSLCCCIISNIEDDVSVKSLTEIIPLFNYELAVEKFGATGTKNWYWWSRCTDYGFNKRLEFLNYLIEEYSSQLEPAKVSKSNNI